MNAIKHQDIHNTCAKQAKIDIPTTGRLLQGNSVAGSINGRNSKIIKDRQKEANKRYGLFSGIIINNSLYD